MRSRAAQRPGSSPRRLGSNRLSSRCGSRRHNRRGLSPNSSRATSNAAAEIREGRAQKARGALHRALSNSTKLRNVKAGRQLRNVKAGLEVEVSSATSGKLSAGFFDPSEKGWPSSHPFFLVWRDDAP